MSWSNERKSMIKGMEFWVRARTTAIMLGTQPSNPNIHRDFIASKNPNGGIHAEQETAAIELAIDKNPDIGADDVDLQMTIFPVARFFKAADTGRLYDPEYDVIPDVEGEWVVMPFIYDYQIRGSFKESIAMLAKASGGKGKKTTKKDEAAPETDAEAPKKRGRKKAADAVEPAIDTSAHYDCADITAYKKVVDGNWFVTNRKCPLFTPETFYDELGREITTYDENGKLRTLQRALRAETAKGPRTALATSEIVPIGTEFFFGVKLLNEKNLKACLETLDYKANMGMLQWRGGGKGTLIWTLCNKDGVPYDDLDPSQLTDIDRSIIEKVNKIIPGAVSINVN